MSSLKSQLSNKLKNKDKFLDKCYKVLDDCSCFNKRYSLLSITSIIIETGMLNAYILNKNADNTSYICDMYDKGILNTDYQMLTNRVRSVRNNLVHVNITTGKDTEKLAIFLESIDEKYFKDALNDLFGKDIKFDDKYLTKMYNILTDILDVETLRYSFDDLLW